jgi:hypothetical protein
MAVSVRVRFEVFKRDGFQCRYCGKKSPEVVLEVDHIVPVCEGGGDEEMNLATACWDCNRGKSGVPLADIMTGSDPHDKAVLILERERQLREYNAVMAAVVVRVESDFQIVINHVCELTGRKAFGNQTDVNWLRSVLENKYSVWTILKACDIAYERNKLRSFQYVAGVLRNLAEQGQA